MEKNLKIIVVEDSENDTLLEIRLIEQAGYKVKHVRVETKEELEAALKADEWDVVLSDFTMPHFSGAEALRVVRSKDDFIPFIFVSGTIGEDRAVKTLKDGASDYILKIDPKRLVSSIERELRDKELRLQRIRAQDQLRESEERYRDLFDSAPVGYHEIDAGGTITRVNRMELKLFGYEHDEMVGKPAWLFVADADASGERVAAKLAETIPVSVNSEREFVRKDGTTFPAIIDESYIRDKNGKVAGIRTVVQEVTARKAAEKGLRESEDKFRTLAEQSPNMIFINREGRVIYANHRCSEVMGYSQEEMCSPDFDFLNLIAPESRGLIKENFRKHLQGQEIPPCEYTLLDKRGNSIQAIYATTTVNFGGEQAIFGTVTDITERKRVDEALAKERQLLRTLMNNLPDSIYFKDAESRFILINPAQAHHLGLSAPAEASGKTDFDFFSDEHARQAYEDEQAIIRTGDPLVAKEEKETWPDGHVGWVATTKMPFRDQEGKIVGTFGVSRDITERKRSEEELRLFRELIDHSNDAVEVIEPETGRFLDVNRKACDDLGYDRDELRKMTIFDIDAELDQEKFSMLGREIEKTKSIIVEARHRRKDQSSFPVEVSISAVTLGRTYAVSVVRDITERKRSDDNSKALMQRLSLATELAEIGVWDLDLGTMSAICDDKMLEILGLKVANPISLEQFVDCLAKEDVQKTQEALQRAIAERKPQLLEFSVIWPDGTLRIIRAGIGVIMDSNQNVVRIVGVAQDITEGRRSQEKIAEQASLLDQSHDAISVMDLMGSIVYWNKGAEELYGWSAGEVLGRNQWMLSAKEKEIEFTSTEVSADRKAADIPFPDEQHRTAFRQVMARGEWKGELHLKTSIGRDVTVLSQWSLVKDKNGKPKSILFISTDVTEQKVLEAQYRRAQRMETLGTLASGIAHDLNNVLTPITLALELLQKKYADDEKTMRLLSTLESTVNRGTGVVRQILTFARGSEQKREHLDPAAIIEDMKRIIQETFPKSIEAYVKTEQGTGLILADKTQIHQVLMNLCVNARDAMPKGGKLTISAKNVMIDEQYAKMSKLAKAGDHVLIQVSDTGMGIKKENQDKLFEPFFTTKELGKGTGLGLSIVQGIVKAHGGFIEVDSELNKGTTFRVYLPVETTRETPVRLELDVKPRLGQGELIIIADDESAIREITKSTLEAYGYNVLDAEDGSEAVALFAQHSNEVALVLTDMVMPVMDGAATIRALRKMKPDLKIIAATGYTDDVRHYDLLNTVNAVLKKPYTAGTLMKCITKVLENEPATT